MKSISCFKTTPEDVWKLVDSIGSNILLDRTFVAQNQDERQQIDENQNVAKFLSFTVTPRLEDDKLEILVLTDTSSYIVKGSYNFKQVINEFADTLTVVEKAPMLLNDKFEFLSMNEATNVMKEDEVIWSPYLLEFYTNLNFPSTDVLLGILMYSGVLVDLRNIAHSQLYDRLKEGYKKISENDELQKYIEERICKWSNHESKTILYHLV